MEWFVQLTGERFDLEELSKALNSPELCVTQEGKDFILKSTEFKFLKDADDVRNKAREILSLINGAARLTLGMQKSLAVTRVVNVRDDGTRQITGFVSISETINPRDKVSISTITTNGIVQEIHQVGPIPSWITTAQHDTNIAKALRLFGNENQDWVNLYRIYEVIESDVGGVSNIVDKGWATKKALKRFKHTANSPTTIGDDSRHGKDTTQPPKNPMELSEAKSIIKTLIHNWLNLKRR